MKLLKVLAPFSLLMIFLLGCGSKKEVKTDEIIPVKIIELKKEPFEKTINVSGVFTTDDETYLSFKTGGIIKSIYVNEGDPVNKDQVLATLELTEIQSQVTQAASAYEKAKRDFERVESLYKDSAATLGQMQDAKTGLNVALESLNIAKFNLKHSEIRAVSGGYVLKKFANEGQLVGPGTPVLMTNGASQGNWLLKAGISDYDWAAIRVGLKAQIQSDADPSKNIEAFVFRKSEGVDPSTGTFSVDLKIKGKAEKIASGLFGKAKIFQKDHSQMWRVPYESVLDGDGNSGYVFTTSDKKTANRVKVNIFDLDKDNVFISQGLEKSRYLIISGSAYLDDGSQIRVDEDLKK
jgi:RND family efflux transporter MFP subunit